MTSNVIIAAESPVPVVIGSWGIYPLTACCQACATGTDEGICCKGCWEVVDDLFGMCWKPDDEAGWRVYGELVVDVLWGDKGVTNSELAGLIAKSKEIVAHVREKVAALG